jgi:hypothetical protein
VIQSPIVLIPSWVHDDDVHATRSVLHVARDVGGGENTRKFQTLLLLR